MPMARCQSRSTVRRPRIPSAAAKKKFDQDVAALFRENPSAVPVLRRIARLTPKAPYSKEEVEQFFEKMKAILSKNPSTLPVFARWFDLLKATHGL